MMCLKSLGWAGSMGPRRFLSTPSNTLERLGKCSGEMTMQSLSFGNKKNIEKKCLFFSFLFCCVPDPGSVEKGSTDLTQNQNQRNRINVTAIYARHWVPAWPDWVLARRIHTTTHTKAGQIEDGRDRLSRRQEKRMK